MSDRLGVELRANSAAAVMLRGDTIVWSNDVEREHDEAIDALLGRLLAPISRRRIWRRVRLGAAVDRSYAQLRRLEGLPKLPTDALTQIVRENAETFFLRRPSGVVTSEVRRDEDGCVAAAFDRDVVDAVVRVVRASGVRLTGVMALDPRSASGRDADGRLAGAGVAARLDRRDALAWKPAPINRRRLRRATSLLSLCIGLILVIVAPALRRTLAERRILGELARSRTVEIGAARSAAELQRVTYDLDQRLAFEASRGRMLELLSDLARALPESTALTSLRADSADVAIVAVSPRVTALLPALSGLPGMTSGHLVGAVSRDLVAGVRLERATLRFRMARRGGLP